jgi:hypothetical protein
MVCICHTPGNCRLCPSTLHVRSYHTIHIVFQPVLMTNTSDIWNQEVRVLHRLQCVSVPRYVEHPAFGTANVPRCSPLVWGI